jgi:NADP-dependent 3-hydroxy acid dehydrogenase YdfG
VINELFASSAEDRIALRGSGRYVARLAPMASNGHAGDGGLKDQVTLDPSGTYLITGGRGGLGLLVAEWMVNAGARRLVLAGRRGTSGISETDRARLAALEQKDASVDVVGLDVTRAGDVAAILSSIDDSGHALRGIVHAAGVLDDGILLQQNLSRFRAVMAPKVLGAWNLHQLSIGRPLDFFVLFSSAAGVIGSPGQANYSAANAFLDALASHRRAIGLPALSLDWGPWDEVGTAAARRRRLSGRGLFDFMRPADALAAMGGLLANGSAATRAQVLVLPLDPSRWSETFPAVATPPLFSGVAAGRASHGGRHRAAIKAAEREQRQPLMESYLLGEVAEVLGLSTTQFSVHEPLNQQGIDSLMAVELRNRIEHELQQPLSPVKLLGGASLTDLAEELVAGLETAPDTVTAAAREATDWLVEERL